MRLTWSSSGHMQSASKSDGLSSPTPFAHQSNWDTGDRSALLFGYGCLVPETGDETLRRAVMLS